MHHALLRWFPCRLNLVVGFASEHSQPAWEPESPDLLSPESLRGFHSHFTHALMKRTQESGTRLDFATLLEGVRRDVAEATRGLQQPRIHSAKNGVLLLFRDIGSTALIDEFKHGSSGPRLTVGDVVSPLLAGVEAHVSQRTIVSPPKLTHTSSG